MRVTACLSTLLGAALGCACVSSSPGPVRYVVSQGPFDCQTQARDDNLAVHLSSHALAGALPAEPVAADSRAALLDVVASDDPRPLVIFYAGHGTDHGDPARGKAPDRSALCFGDGQLLVDELLEKINPRAASAMLVLDGCNTAREDVRKSPVPTAVLSGADQRVSATGTGTAMTDLLVDALRDGDDNQDGIVDDGELLRKILRGLDVQPRLEPRLRRQSFSALPVVARRRGFPLPRVWPAEGSVAGPAKARILARERAFSELRLASLVKAPSVFWAFAPESLALEPGLSGERIEGPLPDVGRFARGLAATEGFLLKQQAGDVALVSLRSGVEHARVPQRELPALLSRFERGEWAALDDDGFVWSPGQLLGDIATWDGKRLRHTELEPWPCSEPFGQCFRATQAARLP